MRKPNFGGCDHVKVLDGGRPRVRDETLEISDLFVSYSITPENVKLSFETE